MPKKATLIHPQTKDKKVVEVNSPESRRWEAQGYVLMTATGEPITAGKPTALTEQPTAQTDISSFLAGIGIQPKGEQYEQEAQMWQYLSGGDMRENPYLAYIEPRVIEEKGKRFLRIPKNQTLKDLAEFFDSKRETELGLRGDIASDFFDYRKDKFSEELDLAKYGLDVQKFGLAQKKTELEWAGGIKAAEISTYTSASGLVTAVDKKTGQTLWQRQIGRAGVGGGGVNIGVTPVVDPETGTSKYTQIVDRDTGKVKYIDNTTGQEVPADQVQIEAPPEAPDPLDIFIDDTIADILSEINVPTINP